MVMRRKVHKLFDLIKCSKWQSIFENTHHKFIKRQRELGSIYGGLDVSEDKHLVLRECIFTWD